MSDLIVLVLSESGNYLQLLDELAPIARVVIGTEPEDFDASVEEADVIVVGMGGARAFPAVLSKAKKARWVHSLSAGVEGILFPEFISSPLPLTNARGVFARSLGEFALAGMLWFAKDLNRMRTNQKAHRWEQFDVQELYGQTLGIVGYGEIGRAAARLARPFGMKILALKRRPELIQDEVDAVYTPDRLNEMAAASDYLLAAAALTPETRGMVGEAALRSMKKSAVIMNLGRGPVIEEEAMIRALREGWIRGAVLDVFETEPLPEGHAFYDLDNVLLSPHCADHTDDWLQLTMRFFVENFQRFAAGLPLENLVDKAKGY
jgi:phosphoglycerate dehydrogenase-like enzyme